MWGEIWESRASRRRKDNAGRLTLLRNPQNDRTTYQYDAADRRTVILRPGTTTSLVYNNVSQITTLMHHQAGGGTIATLSYSYNPAGMRTSAVESGVTLTWGYDSAYRLTSEQRQLGPVILYRDTFTYDAVGNRIVLENAAGRTTYTYDGANQLETAVLGATRTTSTYDANGNLAVENAAGTRTTHVWNDENRLVQVQRTGMTTNQYTFNGDGQRVQVVDSQGTKKPIWDFENVLLETDGAGATQVVYTLEPAGYGNLVSQRRGSTTSFYLFDALGSTRKLTSSAGSPTDSYDYRAYGETFAASGSTTNVFRWVGELGYYYDLDRLAYYLRARPYNPALARFLSRDPIGFEGSKWNLYEYVGSNPIGWTDPNGLDREWVITHPLYPHTFLRVTINGQCYQLHYSIIGSVIQPCPPGGGMGQGSVLEHIPSTPEEDLELFMHWCNPGYSIYIPFIHDCNAVSACYRYPHRPGRPYRGEDIICVGPWCTVRDERRKQLENAQELNDMFRTVPRWKAM